MALTLLCSTPAKAFLFEQTSKVIKSHGGVHREFGRLAHDVAELSEYVDSLNENYDLKSVADYETGPDAIASFHDAKRAVESATRF